MKKIFTTLLFTLLFLSCEKDFDSPLESSFEKTILFNNVLGIQILNERAFFNTREELSEMLELIEEFSEEEVVEFSNELNQSSFISLVPIVDEESEENIYSKLLNTGLINEATDVGNLFDDINDIVGHDGLKLLLNSSGEIQIADEVFKITDTGVFSVKTSNYESLPLFLQENNISTTPYIKTDVSVISEIVEFNKFGVVNDSPIYINQDIKFFNSPINEPYDYSKYEISNNDIIETDPDLNQILIQIPDCSPRNTVWNKLVSGLFGPNLVCKDVYQSKRRVKTKAINQDFGFIYLTYAKVKHQYKGWTGIWRKEKTMELRMFIEGAQFEYHLNAISVHDFGNLLYDRSFYFPVGIRVIQNPVTDNISIEQQNYNSLNHVFRNDYTIDFFGTGWTALDHSIQNGIDSQLSAKQFNNWFYTGIYTATKSVMEGVNGAFNYNSLNKTFISKFPETGNIIMQVSKNSRDFNSAKISKTFDFGAQFGMSSNVESWSNISITSGSNNALKPKNFRIKIIGAVNTGTGWRGNSLNYGI